MLYVGLGTLQNRGRCPNEEDACVFVSAAGLLAGRVNLDFFGIWSIVRELLRGGKVTGRWFGRRWI